jgi:hypothetical protein
MKQGQWQDPGNFRSMWRAGSHRFETLVLTKANNIVAHSCGLKADGSMIAGAPMTVVSSAPRPRRRPVTGSESSVGGKNDVLRSLRPLRNLRVNLLMSVESPESMILDPPIRPVHHERTAQKDI